MGAAELVDEVRTRTIEIAAPHGAKVHAVTFGAQLILPGIFYALSYAFVDMIAVVNPERPSLRRSSQLTFGMKGRLFRMFLIVFLITNLVSYPIALVVQGTPFADMPTKFGEMLIDPTATSAPALVVQEVLGSISMWISTLAVLVLYVEREGQVLAKSALKKLQTPA